MLLAWGAAVIATSIFLVSLALASLGADGPPELHLGPPRSIFVPETRGDESRTDLMTSANPADGTLVIRLLKVDDVSQTIHAAISVVGSNEWRRSFLIGRSLATLRRAFDARGKCVAAACNAYIKLSFIDRYGGDGPITQVHIPLRFLNALSQETANVELPTWSAPHQYPSDWGLFDGYVVAEPNGFVSFSRDTGFHGVVPLNMQVSASTALQGRRVAAAANQTGTGEFELLITRDPMQEWYIYLMSFAPLVMILLVSSMAIRTSRQAKQFNPELLVGLIAAVLAVLPLRAVLVETNVQGLTRVDFILGLELAFMLMICAWSYLASLRRKPVATS